MFRSEVRELIVTQREHARLAGFIAAHWGNESFEKPRLNLHSLVKGITFHQNGYDVFDKVDFRTLSELELVEVYRRDIKVELRDTTAELVNLYHQLRLINKKIKENPEFTTFISLRKKVENLISQKMAEQNFREEDYAWSNRITHLCDKISFNFCFGEPIEEEVGIYPKVETQELMRARITIKDPETVIVDPWPFSKNTIDSLVIGYRQENYPRKLIPELINCKTLPKSGLPLISG